MISNSKINYNAIKSLSLDWLTARDFGRTVHKQLNTAIAHYYFTCDNGQGQAKLVPLSEFYSLVNNQIYREIFNADKYQLLEWTGGSNVRDGLTPYELYILALIEGHTCTLIMTQQLDPFTALAAAKHFYRCYFN